MPRTIVGWIKDCINDIAAVMFSTVRYCFTQIRFVELEIHFWLIILTRNTVNWLVKKLRHTNLDIFIDIVWNLIGDLVSCDFDSLSTFTNQMK